MAHPTKGRPLSTSARNHLALAWCGPVGIVVVLVGWWLFCGFMPPPSPNLPADEIARVWQTDVNLKRLGMVLCVWGGTLYVPFTMAVTVLMRKLERDGEHVLSLAQAGLGVLASVFFTLNFIVFQVTTYRPERAVEATQGLDDLSFFLTFAPAAPFCFQYLVVGVLILQDRAPAPLVPRWVGYANLWISLGAAPGCALVFFKTGPLAWDGLFTFWIPVGVFVAWFFVMFWAVRHALRTAASRAAVSA
jgi:hypothetical protein